MAFCTKCGREEVEEFTGYYDGKTGKKKTRHVCPLACEHGSHAYEWSEGKGFIKKLFGPYLVCRRCGTECCHD